MVRLCDSPLQSLTSLKKERDQVPCHTRGRRRRLFCYAFRMSKNSEIAGQLRQIAALLDEQGVAFKPAAYRRAAQVVEELPRAIETYDDAKELTKLPGIGEAIAAKILEYLATGEIAALTKLRREQGGLSAELMDIEDLGPKRARQIQQELGVSTVAELVAAAEAGKLRGLPRMSEHMERKILENARRVKERTRRFTREEIGSDVEALLRTVGKVEGVQRCAVAGSYRREKETVGDIDMLVVTRSPGKVSDAIAALPMVRGVVAHGGTKLSFDLKSGLRVDVRFVRLHQWGSALLYFTGSKEHNIALRKAAIKRGWKLNEYGLFAGEKAVAGKEEKDIYDALDLRYYEPPERTGAL